MKLKGVYFTSKGIKTLRKYIDNGTWNSDDVFEDSGNNILHGIAEALSTGNINVWEAAILLGAIDKRDTAIISTLFRTPNSNGKTPAWLFSNLALNSRDKERLGKVMDRFFLQEAYTTITPGRIEGASTFASPLHSTSKAYELPTVSKENLTSVANASLLVFALEDFTSDDFEIMKNEMNSSFVLPLGYAISVNREGLVISARHIFNHYNVKDIVLYSNSTDEFYSLGLLIDGARHSLGSVDFIAGRLLELDLIDPKYPPFVPIGEEPSIPIRACITNAWTWGSFLYEPLGNESLHTSATFPSSEGDCGSAWVDHEGAVFALHVKRCDKDLFSYERIGVLIKKYFDPQMIDMESFIYDYPFIEYSGSLGELGQLDESGKKRDEALGNTPGAKEMGYTVQGVLKRYVEEGKAQLLNSDQSNVHIDFGNISSKGDRRNQAKKYIAKRYKDRWKIKVKIDENKEEYKPLHDKYITPGGKNRNHIHMGHVVPAVFFWNEGCWPYLEKHANSLEKDIGKERYQHLWNNYEVSGHAEWIQNKRAKGQYIRKFMLDAANYDFEYDTYNLSKSNEEKEESGGYQEPEGYRWVKKKDNESDKWKLVPRDPHNVPNDGNEPSYKDLSSLYGKVGIKFQGIDVPIEQIQWPSDDYKVMSKVKINFIDQYRRDKKIKMNFEITFTYDDDTSAETKDSMKTLLSSKVGNQNSAFTYSEDSQSSFFRLTYSPKDKKLKKGRMFDHADQIISCLSSMLP